ncbi:hypothetical protein FKM82_012856 [Ascaphus truei]
MSAAAPTATRKSVWSSSPSTAHTQRRDITSRSLVHNPRQNISMEIKSGTKVKQHLRSFSLQTQLSDSPGKKRSLPQHNAEDPLNPHCMRSLTSLTGPNTQSN